MKNAYKKGDIILIRFPFTSGGEFKVRPALVMRNQSDADITILPISTNINKRRNDILIKKTYYQKKPLPVDSVIRTGKITTLHSKLVIKKISEVKEVFFRKVQLKLFRFLQ